MDSEPEKVPGREVHPLNFTFISIERQAMTLRVRNDEWVASPLERYDLSSRDAMLPRPQPEAHKIRHRTGRLRCDRLRRND